MRTHDWTGVFPAIHHFCATDLSAFYFDIRKDSLYCDKPDATKRRACRTVLNMLHRCLTAWLAPALPFTAEESWMTRFGADASVHTTLFPAIPDHWRNDALAEKWQDKIRAVRANFTNAIEQMRREKKVGSSLQIALTMPDKWALGLSAADWADVVIVSKVECPRTRKGPMTAWSCPASPPAPSANVAGRCWKTSGSVAAHPPCASAAAKLSTHEQSLAGFRLAALVLAPTRPANTWCCTG